VQESGVKQFATHMLYHEINTLWIFFRKHLAYQSCHVKTSHITHVNVKQCATKVRYHQINTLRAHCGHTAGNFLQALGL